MKFTDAHFKTLKHHQAVITPSDDIKKAAVAIVFYNHNDSTEVLLMHRAKHPNDPWSGHISFPGGKIDPIDANSKAAAIRETEEELGVKLSESEYVTQLDDLYGMRINNRYVIHIACHAFLVNDKQSLELNDEVADAFWWPLAELQKRNNSYCLEYGLNEKFKTPAIIINQEKEQILWGLTLRILVKLHALLMLPTKAFSNEQMQYLYSLDTRSFDKKRSVEQ